jgi:hypothetical protein
MAKLEIDFVDVTDDVYEHFLFRQEGMKGMKLPGAWLPEFVEALERPNDPERFCFFQNYFVLNNKNGSTISISTKSEPLLQLSAEQRAKLIAHLRSTYAALISVYR